MKVSKCIQHFLSSPPFTKYLLVTNVLAGGAMDFCGDLITQKRVEKAESTNWNRSRRMVTVSLALGVPAHYWYVNLDRWFPLKTSRHIIRKVILDTFGAGPFFITGFYLGGWVCVCLWIVVYMSFVFLHRNVPVGREHI